MTSKLANDTKEEVCRTARPHETQRMYLHVQTEVTGREQQGGLETFPVPPLLALEYVESGTTISKHLGCFQIKCCCILVLKPNY